MATSFYTDAENSRLTELYQHPERASLLRRDMSESAIEPIKGLTRASVYHDSEAMHLVRCAQEERLTMALKAVFENYNVWDGGLNRGRMNKVRFHKLFRCAISGMKGLVSALSERSLTHVVWRVQHAHQDTLEKHPAGCSCLQGHRTEMRSGLLFGRDRFSVPAHQTRVPGLNQLRQLHGRVSVPWQSPPCQHWHRSFSSITGSHP
jgi:hypothetical protein